MLMRGVVLQRSQSTGASSAGSSVGKSQAPGRFCRQQPLLLLRQPPFLSPSSRIKLVSKFTWIGEEKGVRKNSRIGNLQHGESEKLDARDDAMSCPAQALAREGLSGRRWPVLWPSSSLPGPSRSTRHDVGWMGGHRTSAKDETPGPKEKGRAGTLYQSAIEALLSNPGIVTTAAHSLSDRSKALAPCFFFSSSLSFHRQREEDQTQQTRSLASPPYIFFTSVHYSTHLLALRPLPSGLCRVPCPV